MKVILADNWPSYIHELPLSIAMEKAGVTVITFKWNHYFSRPSIQLEAFYWQQEEVFINLAITDAKTFISSERQEELKAMAVPQKSSICLQPPKKKSLASVRPEKKLNAAATRCF